MTPTHTAPYYDRTVFAEGDRKNRSGQAYLYRRAGNQSNVLDFRLRDEIDGLLLQQALEEKEKQEEEVQQLGVEKHEIVVAYSEGDSVRIADGPLTSFIGVVDMVDIEKNKVRVIVSMFGRETPVELELDQVELVNQ